MNKKLNDIIVSIIFYGSFQKKSAMETSDVDIAIITKNKATRAQVEKSVLTPHF